MPHYCVSIRHPGRLGGLPDDLGDFPTLGEAKAFKESLCEGGAYAPSELAIDYWEEDR